MSLENLRAFLYLSIHKLENTMGEYSIQNYSKKYKVLRTKEVRCKVCTFKKKYLP